MTLRAFVDQFTIFLLSYAYQILMCLGSLSWNHFQRDDQAEGLTIAAQESEALFFFLLRYHHHVLRVAAFSLMSHL